MRSVALALLVASCTGTHTYEHFAVRGTVTGLGGATATLVVDSLVVATLSDGPFTVPSAVLDGSMYSLAIGGVSDAHVCTFGPPTPTNGLVAGADLVVSIACVSSDTSLTSLVVTSAPLVDPTIANRVAFTTLPIGLSNLSATSVAPQIAVTVANPDTFIVLDGNELTSGVLSPSLFVVEGDNSFGLDVSTNNGNASSHYTITIPVELVLHLGPATTGNQEFGAAVAISGDGTTLAIGAPNDGTTGAVTIYMHTGDTWQQQVVLRAATPVANGRFGAAVALSQTGDRLVVGAPAEATSTGAAYVFARAAGTWDAGVRLAAATPVANAAFGQSVAIDEAGTTIVAGAPGLAATSIGAAFVFADSAGWMAAKTLAAPAPAAKDQFGQSVAVSSGTVAIGAPGIATGAGRVITYTGATYAHEATLAASNAQAGAHFGAAIALVGNALVVGSPDEASADTFPSADTSAPGAGAAIMFDRATTWMQGLYMKQVTPHAGARFGAAVGYDPSLSSAFVGIPGDGGCILQGGTSTTIDRPDASFTFGGSVAVGGGRAVVGAIDATSTGIVYAY